MTKLARITLGPQIMYPQMFTNSKDANKIIHYLLLVIASYICLEKLVNFCCLDGKLRLLKIIVLI